MEPRTAIVTGTASGIGRATALRLAAEGYLICAVDIDKERNRSTTKEIESRSGTALGFIHEVGASPFDGVVDAVIDETGRVDVLVNNAGVGVAATLAETDRGSWDRTIQVNLTGCYETCRAVIPHMVRAGAGVIVNVASVAALVGLRNRAAYCASKAGLVGLTRAIAADHADQGIRANAVCPGTVETEWIGKILSGSPDPEEARRRMEQRQLDGRMGTPEEVAAGIAFLVSDDARFVNGSTFVMDGGLTTV
jgi:NAD(P)-dependent dehydrogenase (short-subunit alcohol dehydrogenase family)